MNCWNSHPDVLFAAHPHAAGNGLTYVRVPEIPLAITGAAYHAIKKIGLEGVL